MRIKICLLVLLLPSCQLEAQNDNHTDPDKSRLQAIMQRLSLLEEQNRHLQEEIVELQREVGAASTATSASAPNEAAPPAAPPPKPSLDERVAVAERRIEEQSQTKVEAAHKFPISLNGTLLFNAFFNSIPTGGATPNYTDILNGPSNAGATLRQTTLGVDVQGPQLPGGGSVHGNLLMDFFGGASSPQQNWLRIRTGEVSFDWARRSFSVGVDKPLISPYAPNSFAEVGVPPLSGAGNLWLWLPQARYEERINFGQNAGITGQLAVLQTNETYGNLQANHKYPLDKSRPALEGRGAIWWRLDDQRRLEIGTGFHVSSTHVAGYSLPSRVISIDWLVQPWSKFEFSGTLFHGRDFGNLGGLSRGFTIFSDEDVKSVRGNGGWAQISSPLTSRLTMNIFGGAQSNAGSDSASGDFVRDFSYAANLMYRIAPNVIISLEGLQSRTRIVSIGDQTRNRYDVAIAYLF